MQIVVYCGMFKLCYNYNGRLYTQLTEMPALPRVGNETQARRLAQLWTRRMILPEGCRISVVPDNTLHASEPPEVRK